MSCTSSTGRRPFANDLEYTSTSCSCSAVGALPDSTAYVCTHSPAASPCSHSPCALSSPVSSDSSAGTASAHNTLVSSDPADGAATVRGADADHVGVRQGSAAGDDDGHADRRDRCPQRTERLDPRHRRRHRGRHPTPDPAARAGLGTVASRRTRRSPHHRPRRLHDHRADADHYGRRPPQRQRSQEQHRRPRPLRRIGDSSLDQGDGSYSTPTFVRWVLRYASYLAIMAIVGILLTTAYVWTGAGGSPDPAAHSQPLTVRHRRARVPATARGRIRHQRRGAMVIVRIDRRRHHHRRRDGVRDPHRPRGRDVAGAVPRRHRRIATCTGPPSHCPGSGLLATWAFAGHSRSMRWPAIGVATDVAHHAAAAAWIAGLAIVGWIVIPRTTPDVLVPAVRRFSRVAAISVAILVATGLVQTVRLVGSPMDLLDANHGRYLLAKVVVLAVMLGVANANRRRVDHRLDVHDGVGRHTGRPPSGDRRRVRDRARHRRNHRRHGRLPAVHQPNRDRRAPRRPSHFYTT